MPDASAAAAAGPRRRRGRPRGGESGTRERIIAAAVAEFGEQGYDGATIRSIAARTGVDPALVHHYFGTKSDLFAAVVDVPVNPARVLPHLLEGDLDDAGERIVRFLLEVWDSPAFRPRGVAVLRSMLGGRRSAAVLVGFVSREIVRRLGDRIGTGPDAERRASLAASQIVGLIVTRYLFELEPIASAPPDELAATIGPTVQRYLTGGLGV